MTFTLPLRTFTFPKIRQMPNLSEQTVQATQKSVQMIRADGSSEVLNHLALRNTTTNHVTILATKPSDQEHYHIRRSQFFYDAEGQMLDTLIAEHIIEVIDDTTFPNQVVVRAPSMFEHRGFRIAELQEAIRTA